MRKLNVKPNIIDKAVKFVAPGMALKRFHSRAKLAMVESYTGASKSKKSLKNYTTNSADADTALLYEREALVDRSRDMVRNNAIAFGAIETVVTNVVGTGLRLHPKIDRKVLRISDNQADEIESNILSEFSLWADSRDCDIENAQNFWEKQDLILRQSLECGESFVLTPRKKTENSLNPYSLKLQVIEGDRISNPKGVSKEDMYEGIEKDATGRPIIYHICNVHPGSNQYFKEKDWKPIKAEGDYGLKNIIHIFRMLRPGQSRGIPYLTPVIDLLKQLGRHTEAELMGAVVNGLLTVFIKSESGEVNIDPIAGNKSNSADDDLELGYGSILGLRPDESIETVSQNRPNPNFDPFFMSIVKQIGVGLNLPCEMLIKMFESSFTASMAAFLEAWRMFKTRRYWLAQYLSEIYRIWMYEAVALGRVKAPGFLKDPALQKAYLRCQWIGPAAGQLNPVHAATAAEKRIKNQITTRAREMMEYTGEDFDQNVPQMIKEAQILAQLEATKEPENAND